MVGTGHTSAHTSPEGGRDCWTLAKHDSRPPGEGIPALVVHTRHFSCQITTKGAALGLPREAGPLLKFAFLLGISGAGTAPALVTDAIDADRKSARLPTVRVDYRARQMLMIGFSHSDNRQTYADRPR
jgi:hypothetical protein